MKDNFESRLRASSGQAHIDPPGDIWDGINNQLDINEVWSGIETQLDINEVWSEVANQLDNAPLYPVYERIGYILSALPILLLIVASLINGSPSEQTPLTAANHINDVATDAIDDRFVTEGPAGLTIDHPAAFLTENTKPTPTRYSDTGNRQEESKPTPGTQYASLPTPADLNTIPGEEISGIIPLSQAYLQDMAVFEITGRNSELPFSLSAADQNAAIVVERQALKKAKPSVSIGIVASVKNNWLLNPKTLINLDSRELNSTDIDINTEFGLLAAYDLSRSFGIQGELYVFSGEGQKYHEYINGQYLPTEIDLTYSQFELLLSKPFRHYANLYSNFSHRILFGGFIGHLNRSIEIVGTENLGTDNYSSINYGLSAGYQLSYAIGHKWEVTPGFRFRYGLKNIFVNSENEPNILNATRTASAGFNLAIRYRLGQ